MLIQTKILKNALSKIAGIVPTKATTPILENVLFEFNDYSLKISATNLDVCGCVFVPYEKILPNFCLNAKRLYDTVKMIEDEEIEFTLKENYKLTIKTLKGEYKLTAENPEDFPKPPTLEKTEIIKHENFFNKIKKVIYAASTNELKPALTGVFCGKDVVATDGFVLSVIPSSEGLDDSDVSPSKGIEINIPAQTLGFILKFANEITEIQANEKLVQFDFKNENFNYCIISKLIDETFPDYKVIFNQDYCDRIFANRTELLNTLSRLRIFANPASRQIRISFAENLKIQTEDADMGAEAFETLKVKLEGKQIIIGFNADYVIKTLNAMTDEEITIEYREPTKGVIFEGVGHKCVVMPVRLN